MRFGCQRSHSKLLGGYRKATVTQIHSLQPIYAEEHIEPWSRWAHCGPLCTTWGWIPQSTRVLLLSVPLWQQCSHLFMSTSSRIIHHVTKLTSSQTSFLNIAMSWLYSNGLMVPFYYGNPHDGCTAQRSSAAVMSSCQISSTSFNLCHQESRTFWRQKEVESGASKVYLMKRQSLLKSYKEEKYVCEYVNKICVSLCCVRILSINKVKWSN